MVSGRIFKARYPKLEIFPVSAEKSEGLDKLKKRLSALIPEEKPAPAEPATEEPG